MGELTTTGLSEYGIHRGLKSHHIQLLAISGVIGTGLFVGTSSVLNSAGPAGLLIGYSIWYVVHLQVCSSEYLTHIAGIGACFSCASPMPWEKCLRCFRYLDPL